MSLVGTIDQSVGASTSTGSLTSSVPSSSEGSVNTFQAGCVELLSECNIEDNLPASETQLSSTEFNATLTQVKAKMLSYYGKQARDIAAGRRRRPRRTPGWGPSPSSQFCHAPGRSFLARTLRVGCGGGCGVCARRHDRIARVCTRTEAELHALFSVREEPIAV